MWYSCLVEVDCYAGAVLVDVVFVFGGGGLLCWCCPS